ncbi:tRNA (cytidine(34)-2'-O)-methyltransferase [Amorphus sp. 3PC139-8]|uniref:tRNA (cytidine(34)-2'-O)-methyltransferase n=1 Tax=Amorphus sp. 3PC139-8 TaxID=2735676 RepID=UPI00345D2C48
MTIRLALYQPDIPQNTGTILRTAACFGLAVDLIEPAGFTLSDKALRRAGLDYLERAALVRHASWEAFQAARASSGGRLVLFTTRASATLDRFQFAAGDTLLFGRESAGVPDTVHAAADERIKIAMVDGARSLNLAISVGIVAADALRQLGGLPVGVRF